MHSSWCKVVGKRLAERAGRPFAQARATAGQHTVKYRCLLLFFCARRSLQYAETRELLLLHQFDATIFRPSVFSSIVGEWFRLAKALGR